MERWCGKIVVVSGASSGIGWGIVQELLNSCVIVIGLARRGKLMEELRASLTVDQRERFFPRQCNLDVLSDIKSTFEWIEQHFQCVHILINNAGMVEHTKLLDENNEEVLRRVIDINLMGMVYVTKQAFRLMKTAVARGDECHIITINSLLGHTVPLHIPEAGFNLYPVAKHALRAANEVLRRELFPYPSIRLSELSPGVTNTEFGKNTGDQQTKQKGPLEEAMMLQVEDIVRGVVFILALPSHVTVAELLMVPTRERY